MCYPTIDKREKLPINEKACRRLLWEAIRKDFTGAVSFLKKMSEECLAQDGRRLLKTEDPDSTVGQELKEVLSSDINREVLSEYACHGLVIGFKHCCSPIMAKSRRKLRMSALEQLQVYKKQTNSFGVCAT